MRCRNGGNGRGGGKPCGEGAGGARREEHPSPIRQLLLPFCGPNAALALAGWALAWELASRCVPAADSGLVGFAGLAAVALLHALAELLAARGNSD